MRWRTVAVAGLLSLGLGGCHRRYAYTSVPSGAMAPTIQPGTAVSVDFNAYKHGRAIQRWDIIAFKDQHAIVVKRVVGLPGETLSLNPNGKTIVVNGRTVPVPRSVPWYGKHLTARTTAEAPVVGKTVRIPAGKVYVLGDNLAVSEDSRDVGPIAIASVTGKVVLNPANQANP